MGDRVLFTDESRFSLNTDSHRAFIRREPGTGYLPSNVREIDNCGRGGLIVWAGIMLNDRTPFHVFEGGSVTGVRYRSSPMFAFSGVHGAPSSF
ncbi:HTH_Tnp_Tc3_2 domain-containing protein [Trichonephila clavipes]|nr:HTH_Tnp_Tc3_2 domain-containing protein [Trichonephila clavipes]